MAASDDPAAALPAAEPRARVGTALGIAITVIAIVLAVAFGVDRADDDTRIAKEVVALHELPPETAPVPADGAGAPGGFAANAAADGWVPIGTRRDELEGRETRTTYWQKAGSRVAYTTVTGPPVEIPQTGRQTGRRGLLLRSFDGAYTESLTADQARRDDVLVATTMAGAPVSHDHGGPVRLVVAPMYFYKSLKWLGGVEVAAAPPPGYWEVRGYDVDAWVGRSNGRDDAPV